MRKNMTPTDPASPSIRRMGLICSLVAMAQLSACSFLNVGPSYLRPEQSLPWQADATPNTNADGVSKANNGSLAWWKGFNDPVLDGLLEEAARHNQDLALASARVAEAQAVLAQNQSNFFPSLDLNASASRQRLSENSATPLFGAYPISQSRQLGLSASYELDFWGKFAQADAAARARLLSQTANQGTVLNTLYANVAQSYFALRALDQQLILAQKISSTRLESLDLQKRRLQAGVIGELDWRQAESEAASAQASLQQVRQSRANAEAALATLLGRQPTAIFRPNVARGEELSELYARQAVPSYLSADILTRRPDIVSAEQNLIATYADIAQARTAYFPKLSLTASVGQQSKSLSNLFDPSSMFWNFLGNLTQPIFRAGALGSLVAASNARQQQALAQYTQAVQNAFRDVHDALNNIETGRQVVNATSERVASLRHILKLADLRYEAGYSAYIEVLGAQRDLAQAESGLLDLQRNQLNAVVSLYTALGGGWDAQSLAPPTVLGE